MRAVLRRRHAATAAAIFSLAVSRLQGETINDISEELPLRILQRSVSSKFYQSLLISPIHDRVAIRAQVSKSRLTGARIIRPSLNAAHNDLALRLAGEMNLSGNNSIGSLGSSESVLLHLLIYRIADGTMALSFVHLDGPGGSQMKYYGSARLLVSKSGGKWLEIDAPAELRGKGLAVRETGVKNNLKLDRVPRDFSMSAPR